MTPQQPQDPTFYRVVETGPASWALLYESGEFYGGFATRELAMEQAQTNLVLYPSVVGRATSVPTSIEQATTLAQIARDDYLGFLIRNPQADAEARAPYVAQIDRYDSFVSSFAGQQGLARTQVSATDDLSAIQQSQRLVLADNARKAASAEAVSLRQTSFDGLAIAQADSRAFEAERSYQNLLNEIDTNTENSSRSFITQADATGASTTYGVPNSQLVQRSVQDVSTTGSIVDVTKATANSAAQLSNNLPGSMLTDYNSLATSTNAAVTGALSNLNNPLSTTTTAPSIDSAFAAIGGSSLVGGSNTGSASTGGSERRVRITAKSALREKMFTELLAPLKDTGGMIFPYTPTITNQASANYSTIATVHANQDWHIYQNTPSVQLVINGVFTAQNETEAKYMLASMHFLRVVTKMHFGDADANKGLPPPQMLLDGYGTYMYNQLSVIINSYNVDLPNNVDYVDVNLGGAVSQVPAVTNITVTCTVQNTPKKSREFDWDKFASGELMKAGRWI